MNSKDGNVLQVVEGDDKMLTEDELCCRTDRLSKVCNATVEFSEVFVDEAIKALISYKTMEIEYEYLLETALICIRQAMQMKEASKPMLSALEEEERKIREGRYAVGI